MNLFKKLPPAPVFDRMRLRHLRIEVERDGVVERLPLKEWEKISHASFVPALEFPQAKVFHDIVKKTSRAELDCKQLWLGSYYRSELEGLFLPDVRIRWIDERVGCGVFAARPFKPLEFIAEYTGIVRRRKRSDRTNSYCFAYQIAEDIETPYLIDAQEQGGISRFLNHSAKPNLTVALAARDGLTRVIFYTARAIETGEQILYDYGPLYWKKRPSPIYL